MQHTTIPLWRIILTAGIGFFTDAYDLFIIGIVTTLLQPYWHLSTTQLALLNAASLAAAAFGAVFFGILSDRLGRKKLYGIELLILFFGAILSALSTSFIWLLITRIIVGFAIGGDYPSSAVIASEHATSDKRGFIVLLVFAMQALGLVIGPLFACLLLSLKLSPDITWRILLAAGAVPAACVFYLRRSLQESHIYQIAQEAKLVSRVIADITDHAEPVQHKLPIIPTTHWNKRFLKYLFATAGAWFLLDVAFYGNGISSLYILDQLNPQGTILSHTIWSTLLFLVFAVPGYFLAAKYVDVIGRKTLQILGFGMISICYLAIACLPTISGYYFSIFIGLFGLSFLFVNFGPNATTFLFPAEVFPTNIRAKGHGFSAAIGKVGAFIGAFALPLFFTAHGLSTTFILLSIVTILGALITLLLPEMKKVELEI